jgi:hypothetical protein
LNKIVTSLVTCAICAPAFSTTLFSTGFEASEGYTAGTNLGTVSPWNILDSNPANFEISNAMANGGTQSIAYDTAPNFGNGWAWVSLSYDPGSTSEQILQGSVDIFLTDDAQGNSVFGLGGYDSTGSLVGGLFVDGTDLNLDDQVGTTSGGTVSLNSWNTFMVQLDYSTNTLTGFLNGSQVATSTFDGTTVTDFDLFAAATAFNAAAFDNYNVSSAPVPEPASLAVLALGGIAMLRRRKKA